MKKFLIAVLTALCFTCIGFAAACSEEEPNYYILNFEDAEGVEYVCDIPNGYEVKDGAEVSFTIELVDNAIGEPFVRANETELTADGDGVYKFVMKEETKVTVSNVYIIRPYTITFDAKNYRVNFKDEQGESLDTITADEGTVVKFKIDVSVYHDRTKDFDVSANSILLKPVDGVYSFTVTDDTTVSVDGLETAEGFVDRPDTGSGTADDPYLISEPVDLYYMRELINNDFYAGRFGAAHYKLTKDIDLEGEQLFILGDGTYFGQFNQLSYFSGSFDGDGHTISNYYISETQWDSLGNQSMIPYLGLFGYVMPTADGPVEIKNLTLKNFTLDVDGAKEGGAAFFAGGLVGYGVGVNITNCKVEGVINANGPEENYFGFVGGVAGYIMSAYGSEELKFNSTIISTGSDVEVNCNTGWIFAAGGIAGVLDSADDKATSYILNSYATNSVYGAIYTGGLVGNMGAYSSVKNSYFTGKHVEASSNIPDNASLGRYAHSYGGGIAGYASYESVIADCFTSGNVSAYAVSGNNFEHKDEIAGYRELAGVSMVDVSGAAIINTHYNTNSATLDKQYATDTLGWVESDWQFNNGLPVPNGAPKGNFTLTVDYGRAVNGGDTKTVTLSGNSNMAQLYENGKIDQFVSSGNLMSYGYYFDKNLTQRVSFGYVPSGNVTLYTGFANYNDVAGTYYLRGGNGAYLELNSDGTLVYRDGALSHVSYYIYDGTNITLVENAAFEVIESQRLTETATTENSIYFSAVAIVQDDGSLSIVNIASGYSGNAIIEYSHYYDAANPLLAVKKIENFVYGSYRTDSGIEYIFNPDGTGSFGGHSFTYTVSGTTITTTIGGTMNGGVVDGDGNVVSLGSTNLSKFDAFRGVWEKSASSHKQYTFDGQGAYTYEYFEYVNGTDGITLRTITKTSGTYTVTDGVMRLDNGEIVVLNAEGYLAVNHGNYTETYYMQSSFVGEWRYFNTEESIGLTFNGMSNKGYGTGSIIYGEGVYEDEFDYEAFTVTEGDSSYTELIIYIEDSLIGRLRYSEDDNTLRGEMYSLYYGASRSGVIFCLYDDFKGKWISEQFGVVEFNGLGNYNLGGGTSGIIRTRGEVTVDGVYAGVYTLEGYNLKGTFVYGGKTYTIEYREDTKIIKVTESQTEFDLIGLDRLYNTTFVSESGDKYVFNGGGYLANGGKLSKNGIYEYMYTVDGDGKVEIYSKDGGEKIGGFAVSEAENVFVLTVNGSDIKLTYDNKFTGTWVVGGAVDGTLVIGVIGADATASGSYLGKTVTFSYDVENATLSFTADNGSKLNVYSYTAKDVTELMVGLSTSDENAVICVNQDRAGALRGIYTASADKKLYLDGMNVSLFGKGTAILYDGDSAVKYSYRLDGENVILSGNGTFVLKAVSADVQGAYVKDGKAYSLITPDALFDLRVWDAKRTTIYRFDGLGKVTATYNNQVTEFTYVIDSYNDVTRVYELTLTDSQGKEYSAVYEFTGNAYITVTEKENSQNA